MTACHITSRPRPGTVPVVAVCAHEHLIEGSYCRPHARSHIPDLRSGRLHCTLCFRATGEMVPLKGLRA